MTAFQNELTHNNPPAEKIREILKRVKTVAIVGLSPKETRDSHRVARYLMEQGYDIIPVNPGQKEILGRPCFRNLTDIPFGIDMVDIFLNPTRVPPVVDQVVKMGVSFLWMQLGVIHEEAARRARDAGITVVMNKCVKQEHEKLLAKDTPPEPFQKA